MLIEAPVHDSVLYNAWHVAALADDVKVDQPLQVNSWVNQSLSGGSKTRLLPAKIAALIGVGRFRRDGLAPLGQLFVRIM